MHDGRRVSNQPLFVTDRPILLADLGAGIARATEALSLPDQAAFRIVAFESSARVWFPFALSFEMGRELPAVPPLLDLGRVRLISIIGAPSTFADVDSFREFLQSWRHQVPTPPDLTGFVEPLVVRRQQRDTSDIPLPSWQFAISPANASATQQDLPTGPFVSADPDLFAPTVASVAAQWLGEKGLSQWSSPRMPIQGSIWDSRAYFEGVIEAEDGLAVQIRARVEGPFVARAMFRSLDASETPASKPIVDGRATVPVPESASSYQLFLLGPDNFAFDERRGSLLRGAGRDSLGPSLLRRTTPRGLDMIGGAESLSTFVDEERLRQLRDIEGEDFDLKRLIRLLEEANVCYGAECWSAVAALTRAILDHVPPIFSAPTFSQVASNHPGKGRSFKPLMAKLDESARKIADAVLHEQIQRKESVPTRAQVNFSHGLDVLLAEIVRILS